MGDGGPALPVAASDDQSVIDGMSLRDWFAGMLQGLLASGAYTETATIRTSYEFADAMIVECDRSKGIDDA